MKRLTQKDEQGNWCLKGLAWAQLYVGQMITEEVNEKLYGALWKLMEYEDAGLTPDEIMDGKMLTGWIPVEEQLPGTERILITDGEVVKEGYRRPDGIWKYGVKEDELFSRLSSKPVIAWMPLPEPYAPQTEDLTE